MIHTRIKNLKVGSFGHFRYNTLLINHLKSKIERFILDHEYLDSPSFAASMMFPQEIGFNNLIEGIYDDISDIIDDISSTNISSEDKNRITNIFKGYQYISSSPPINAETLKELYGILSNGLLDEYSSNTMGEYYREKEVFVLRDSLDMADFDRGVPSSKVGTLMDDFFSYVNQGNEESDIDEFIKSQVMHLYFVYVHPYYDVNGRCGRTVSMWHLLNKGAYPYVIFNRGIYFSKFDYKKMIRFSLKTHDMTVFLEYILRSTLRELKKEVIINALKNHISLSVEDNQVLQYFLSIREKPTLENLARFYNGYDPHKSSSKVIDEKIMPLVERGVLVFVQSEEGDEILRLNRELFQGGKELVKNRDN